MNGDNFRFLDALRNSYGEYAQKVAVCGLLSCRGDAYKPADALAAAEAREFHLWQATMLAEAGVDFLLAATLPALSEATGLASALAATGKPYIVSFVVRPEGAMLDGTPLKDAGRLYRCRCRRKSAGVPGQLHSRFDLPICSSA